MEAITIPHVRIPSINIGGICLPGIGAPGSIGKKELIWPAGMKEHIKAWYDPKKQGMTNFDVIEAYVEDFTKFIKNGNGTFAQNKYTSAITKQEWLLYKTNGKEIEAMDVYVTSDSTDKSTTLRYYYYTNEDNNRKVFYLKAGLNHLPASCYKEKGSTIGFVFEAAPASEFNITITQLPTSILKDLSGNGNHAYLYGGKGKLNSGMGVYGIDVTENIIQQNRFEYLYDNITKEVTFIKALSTGTYLFTINKNIVNSTQQIKFEGIDSSIRFINSTTNETYYNITEDGIYDIEFVTDANTIISTNYTTNQELNLKVQFLPYYPDQLCYDGKMYAVCYGFPILTDYTVMADRTWFEKEEYSAFISNSLGGMEEHNNGAFSVELKSLNSFTTISFGSITSIGIPEKGVTYQTKQSYNGNSINVGTKESNDILILGGRYFYKNGNVAGNTWTGCHGTIIIADRSFTEEEINWLKQNWDKI